MKFCVINDSGNVGKTTMCACLLQPRMLNAQIVAVETLNAADYGDGIDVEYVKAKNFGDVMKQVMLATDIIVDVGASNVELFVALLQEYEGSESEFDFFVVPTTPAMKQQTDTISTLRTLKRIGVPPERIRVIFNQVETGDDVHDEFAPLMQVAKAEKLFVVIPQAIVRRTELFGLLNASGKSLSDVIADSVDYREKLRGLTDLSEKEACVEMIALKRLATSAQRNLDAVYDCSFL